MSFLHRISVDLEAHIKPRVRMHYLEFKIACELKKLHIMDTSMMKSNSACVFVAYQNVMSVQHR